VSRVGPDVVRPAETTFGAPRVVTVAQEILPWELDLIERICGDTRFHDVTVFTMVGEAMALIHKPSDPAGALWAVTGGIEPNESMADAVVRETWEETGLCTRPVSYVLRMEVLFTCGLRRRPWTSHVFLASPASGFSLPGAPLPHLTPVDTHEVEYAQWVTVERFRTFVAPTLLASGWGRFQYRLALTEHLFRELGL